MAICALSTEDNPFNPITDYDNWANFDQSHGYNSASYLARMVKIDQTMSEEEVENAIEDAVDRIVKLNLTGNYKKVTLD